MSKLHTWADAFKNRLVLDRAPAVLSIVVGVAVVALSVTGVGPTKPRLNYLKSSASGQLFATPNPVQICSPATSGTTTLSWSPVTSGLMEIRQGSETGTLVASSVWGSGQQTVTISGNTTFYLRARQMNRQYVRGQGWVVVKSFVTVEQLPVTVTSAGCSSTAGSGYDYNYYITHYDLTGDRLVTRRDWEQEGQVAVGNINCPIASCDINGDGLINVADWVAEGLKSKIFMATFDLNGDGTVDKADYDMMGQVSVGNLMCPKASCDVNGDGRVDASDLVLVGRVYQADYLDRYDLNRDGTVDMQDWELEGQVSVGNLQCPQGVECDLNGDGVVNVSDWTLISNKYREYQSAFLQ